MYILTETYNKNSGFLLLIEHNLNYIFLDFRFYFNIYYIKVQF